jgi:FdhD protein
MTGSQAEHETKEDGQLTGRTARRRVVRVTVPSDGFPGRPVTRADLLATEEPLGIRVDGSALTATMRPPGDDVELAAGFLVGEAVVPLAMTSPRSGSVT